METSPWMLDWWLFLKIIIVVYKLEFIYIFEVISGVADKAQILCDSRVVVGGTLHAHSAAPPYMKTFRMSLSSGSSHSLFPRQAASPRGGRWIIFRGAQRSDVAVRSCAPRPVMRGCFQPCSRSCTSVIWTPSAESFPPRMEEVLRQSGGCHGAVFLPCLGKSDFKHQILTWLRCSETIRLIRSCLGIRA